MQSPLSSSDSQHRVPPLATRLQFATGLDSLPVNTSPTLVSHPANSSKLSALELEDVPSFDPLEPHASFNQSLQSHLAGKPLWPLSGTSSRRPAYRKENCCPVTSSSPLSSSPAKSSRRRAVVFSNTPLASLNASPKHTAFFHPYHHAQRRKIHIYSDGTSSSSPSYSSSPPSTPPAARSDTKRVGASAALPTLLPSPPSSPTDEDDTATDDEAEETIVEALLLSQEQIANSPPKQAALALPAPLAPFSLPSPSRTGLRSILKKSSKSCTIMLVGTAAEGSKRNGRRKHATNFDECFKDLVMEVASSGGKQSETAKTPASGKADGKTKEGGTRKPLGAGVNGDGTGAGAGNGEEDGRGGDENRGGVPVVPASSGGGRIVYAIKDDDPVHFESPLLTLCASLRPLSDSHIRQRHSSSLDTLMEPTLLPRASTSRLPDAAGTSSSADLPIILSDIETAYTRLTRAISRLPTGTLECEVTTFAPLRQCRDQLRRCLERDIGNISSFPSWAKAGALPIASAEGPSSSPSSREKGKGPAKVTLPDDQMRRLKDEVGVAQIAIKTAAAIFKDSRVSKLFSDDDLSAILSTILNIPGTPNLSSSIYKDLYPFVSFSLQAQRLSPSFLLPHLPLALSALSHTLAYTDKLRQNLSEAIPAIGQLLTSHPREMLERGGGKGGWFMPVAKGLWDTGKRGTSVRVKALACLGSVARALSMGAVEGGEGWKERRGALAEEYSVLFYDLLTETSSEGNGSSSSSPSKTNIHLLEQQTDLSLKPMSNGKVDDTVLLWLINLLALIPFFLGPRFRKLESKGIRPFVALFNKYSDSPSPHMRTLTALLWNHVTRAFLSVPLQGAKEEMWIFRDDKKPFQVLTSIFDHRRKGDWQGGKEGVALSPARLEKHKSSAQSMAHAVVGMITGFSVFLFAAGRPPLLAPHVEINPILNDATLGHLDFVWDALVVPQILTVVRAPFAATPPLGWATLAALIRPRTEQDRTASLERLVNPVLFESAIAVTKEPAKQELIMQRALRASAQAGDTPAWGWRWTVGRVDKVLGLLGRCLGKWDGEQGFALEFVEESIMPVWRNLLLSFRESDDDAAWTAGMLKLVSWTGNFLQSAPTKRPATGVTAPLVAHLFVAELFEVLGAALVKLPEAEATAHNRPWLYLASIVLDSPHSMPSADADIDVYTRAVLATLSLPLAVVDKRMLLARATTKVVSPESQVDFRVDGLYLDFGEALAKQWLDLIASNDSSLDVDSLSTLSRLICAHPRSASWLELSAVLNTAIFTTKSTEEIGLRECLLSSSASLVNYVHIRLLLPLVQASISQSPAIQAALAELAVGSLQSLFAAPRDDEFALIAQLLEAASDAQLARLYPVALEGLQPLVKLTSEGLVAVLPILRPIKRAFQANAVETQGDHSVDPAVFEAFADFWRATFAEASDVEVPAELADALKVLRDLGEPLAETVGESQTQATQNMRRLLPATRGSEPLEEQTLPAAAQRLRSSRSSAAPPVSSTDSPTKADISGRGYDADISTASPLRTTFASTSTSAHVPVAPSPSLRAPADDVVPPSPSVLEETPREVIELRHRASLAETALAEQSAHEQRDVSPELGQPSPPKSSKKRGPPSIISDSDDSDEAHVISRPRPSQASNISSARRKSNGKQKATWNTPLVVDSPVAAIVAPSSAASVKRRKTEPYVEIVSSTSSNSKANKPTGREERATKRSLSVASVSSSLDGSAKKRRKKAKSGEQDSSTKSRPTSSPPRPNSPRARSRSRSVSASPPRAASSSSSSSGINSPRDPREERTVRDLLAMSSETVVRTAAKVGSSPRAAMTRLLELGEQAKLYFEMLRQQAGGGSQ